MTISEEEENAAGILIAVTLALSVGYAIVRYHVVGDVPWKDFPVFILNKGFSLAALIMLSLNFGFGPMKNIGVGIPSSWLAARRALGMTGFLLALIHALMSFFLLSPANYAKFYLADGTYSGLAQLSMLGGIIAFVILWAYNLSFQTHMREDKAFIGFITSRRFMLTAMLFTAAHLFFMGYQGWLNPASWQGSLPPISLVAMTIFVVCYVVNLVGRD